MERLTGSIRGFVEAVRRINERYRHPRIKVTRMVSFWLLMLRVYLIGMLLLLAYRFITLVAR